MEQRKNMQQKEPWENFRIFLDGVSQNIYFDRLTDKNKLKTDREATKRERNQSDEKIVRNTIGE